MVASIIGDSLVEGHFTIFFCTNSVLFSSFMDTFFYQFADNEDLQSEWIESKRRNKINVASFIKEKTGYVVSPDAMFDVQVSFPPSKTAFPSSRV
jgi:hypothetical protein